jgi:hypothetical protein
LKLDFEKLAAGESAEDEPKPEDIEPADTEEAGPLPAPD